MENKEIKKLEPIPKVIHQIWIGPRDPPLIWINTWKNDYIKKYPEWKYKLWTNKDVDSVFAKYSGLRKIFDREPKLCGKADIMRYLILYEHGGIYIDADSVWVNKKDLTELIKLTNKTGIFGGYYKNLIANGVFGCTKNNEYLLTIIDKLKKFTPRMYDRIRRIKGVSKVVGPVLFTTLLDYKITVFPMNYFYPMDWFGIKDINKHKKIEIPEESYMFQYGLTTNNLEY